MTDELRTALLNKANRIIINDIGRREHLNPLYLGLAGSLRALVKGDGSLDDIEDVLMLARMLVGYEDYSKFKRLLNAGKVFPGAA